MRGNNVKYPITAKKIKMSWHFRFYTINVHSLDSGLCEKRSEKYHLVKIDHHHALVCHLSTTQLKRQVGQDD